MRLLRLDSVLRRFPTTLCCCWLLFAIVGQANGQFNTILDIPPDPNIGDDQSVGSDTQVNLLDGGMIGHRFEAGASDGTNRNVEVNVSGGSVGAGFRAFGGTIANIDGGSVSAFFQAFSGSTVNISGGSVGRAFDAHTGSLTNISGGALGRGFRAHNNSTLNISGGSFGDQFQAEVASAIKISGGEFRLDGVLIDGLGTVGDTLLFNLPEESVLSGAFADGTPFAFSSLDLAKDSEITRGDVFAHRTLTLQSAVLPAIGPPLIFLPADPTPLGIRTGQTLVVEHGGVLGDNFNAGLGSNVRVTRGRVGRNFEALGAQVTISGGMVGVGFDAFHGSLVNISGGSVASNGGHRFEAHSGSTVNISGGLIADYFDAKSGSTVNISGGAFDEEDSQGPAFHAFGDSEVNLFGTQFLLDSVDITTSLTPNDPFTINDRDVTLNGLLVDGSAFALDLNSDIRFITDSIFFAPDATLTVTLLVPGDVNADGVVDINDYSIIRDNFNSTGVDWTSGDLNFDGEVNLFDFVIWRDNAFHAPGAVPVPEPASFILALLAVVAIALHRREA